MSRDMPRKFFENRANLSQLLDEWNQTMKVLQTAITRILATTALVFRSGSRIQVAARAAVTNKPNPNRSLAACGGLMILLLMPSAVSAQTLTHRYSFFN